MKEGKVGVLVLQVLVLVLVLGLGLSSASSVDQQRNRRKAMLPAKTTSLLVRNKVGSSVVLPIHGNVYPTGFYNVTLNLGDPPKPYFLDPDTGSDLTWLQCEAEGAHLTEAPHLPYQPSNLVACKDPICDSLPHPPPDQRNCEKTPDQCDYLVQYTDGSSSHGALVSDAFSLKFTNGVQHKPHLALGCGYNQVAGRFHHPSDGVLGLGKGKSSIVSQLNGLRLVRNVIGHCLSSRGGGYLFIGDDLYDPSRVVWTSMSPDNAASGHYSPGIAELMFGRKTTGIKKQVIIFDSASTYTYLDSQAYRAFASLVQRVLTGTSLSEVKDGTLPLCWRGRKPFKNVQDVTKYFKSFALSFSTGGKANTQFELPPEAYLIISSKGNVCLGILDGQKEGAVRDYEIIVGDISMQDKMVIYDNEKQLIGWVRAKCDQIPKSKSSSF